MNSEAPSETPKKQMDKATRDEMLGILCEMSERQVEPCVKPRLRALMGRENEDVKDELLGIIDDCVYFAWTSDFEIKVMHMMWESIGGSAQELYERNKQFGDKAARKEMQKRFKWVAKHDDDEDYDIIQLPIK